MRFFWHRLLCLLVLFALSSTANANPAEELERAWAARDESALIKLHTPTCWTDEQDSGSRVYRQIKSKPLEFRLSNYRVQGQRGVATYEVYQNGRQADRVYTYFADDRVVAFDENEDHAALYLLGILDGRIRLDELKGSEELDALGRHFLAEPPPTYNEHLHKDSVYLRSRLMPQTGLALLQYQNQDEEFAIKVARMGREWRPVGMSFLPSVRSLIPESNGLVACATNLKNLTEDLEFYSQENSGRYPEGLTELKDHTRCPESQKEYNYAVTSDLRWFGLVCEGKAHVSPHYPAASRSSGVRLASTGSRYSDCADNLRSLLPLLEKYKAQNGSYPQALAYLVDGPGIHLPRCSEDNRVWAANETDYALMHLPGGLHLFCTSVEHTGEGFGPLQPSFIDGVPAKALFLLKSD